MQDKNLHYYEIVVVVVEHKSVEADFGMGLAAVDNTVEGVVVNNNLEMYPVESDRIVIVAGPLFIV